MLCVLFLGFSAFFDDCVLLLSSMLACCLCSHSAIFPSGEKKRQLEMKNGELRQTFTVCMRAACACSDSHHSAIYFKTMFFLQPDFSLMARFESVQSPATPGPPPNYGPSMLEGRKATPAVSRPQAVRGAGATASAGAPEPPIWRYLPNTEGVGYRLGSGS